MTGAHSQVRVPVRTGLTGDGLVQITPVDGGTLAAGDAVLTGENYLQPGAGIQRGGNSRHRLTVVPPG
jgi:hypothetical protein